MFSLRSFFIVGILTAVIVRSALGAESDAEKWYEVEVILFSQPEGSLQAEHWVPDPGLPTIDKSTEHLTRASSLPSAGGATASANIKSGAGQFQILTAADLRMNGIADKLNGSAGYRVMLHTAWRQPVPKGERGVSVAIDHSVDAGQSNAVDTVDTSPFIGTISLTSTRYLHLAVDILYRQPELLRAASNLDASTPRFSMGDSADIAVSQKTNTAISGFRLTESRRIRLEQLQYFDHPLFGAIVRVTSYDNKPSKAQ